MHTTASDGRCSPRALVARVQAAGVTTCAITDHDTLAGTLEARPLAAVAGVVLVPALELTAAWSGRDVHVLGYWVDTASPSLAEFLVAQRARRVARAEAIGDALARAGAPVDLAPLLDEVRARPGASVGRPGVARLLVAAGHAVSVQDAFERLLGEGRPAYVRRRGVAPKTAFAAIHAAGGIASLAHPGVTRQDEMIETWAGQGLDAIEAYHSDHTEAEQRSYAERASALGLAVTGGSDFHGDPATGQRQARRTLGGVTLPAEHFEALRRRAAARRPS